MFAQDQFAGQHVNCPECRTGNVIPQADGTSVNPDTSKPDGRAPESTPTRPDSLDSKADRDEAFARLLRAGRPPVAEPDAAWRTIARVAIMATTSWMILLMFIMLQKEDLPGYALFFDILLIGGLTFSRIQMRTGPYPVFLTAALTVAVSMPLLSQMGFSLMDAAQVQSYNEHRQAGQLEISQELADRLAWMMCSFAGLIVSAPIWVAGLKVAAAQRQRDERKK